MKLLPFIILLGCFGCRSVPSVKSVVQSGPSVSLPSVQSRSLSAVKTPAHYFLAWDWVTNSGPVGFQIYHSTNLSNFAFAGGTNVPAGFTLFTNVMASPVPIATDQAAEFFIVRATNSIGPSDWGR